MIYQSAKYTVGCHVAKISSGITFEIDHDQPCSP